MALPSQRRAEVIDLTGDSDSDGGGGGGGDSNSRTHKINRNARSFPAQHASPFASFEPPAKRVKLARAQNAQATTESLVRHYAQAGAREAALNNPSIHEGRLREKLTEALHHQFGKRIAQQKGSISEGLHENIIASRKGLLSYLITLQECHQTGQVLLPAPRAITPSPRAARPHPPPTSSGPANPTRHGLATPYEPGGSPGAEMLSYAPTSASSPKEPLSYALAHPAGWSTPRTVSAAHRPTSTALDPYPPASSAASTSTPKTVRPRREPPRTPTTSGQPKSGALTSPANFTSRAKKAAWASVAAREPFEVTTNAKSYFALTRRPYVGVKAIEAILRSNGQLRRLNPSLLGEPQVFHVDFTLEEIRQATLAAYDVFGKKLKSRHKDEPHRDLAKLLKRLKDPNDIGRLALQIGAQFQGRQVDDIRAFLYDIYSSLNDILKSRAVVKNFQSQHVLSLERDSYDARAEDLRESRLSSLLLAREMLGSKLGLTRRVVNFQDEYRKVFEDGLEMRCEFTNCAGDLSTISWVSNQTYIAGTTVHMDSHNQQYNKPGNLVLGSVSRGSAALKAYSDHRIPRPLVERGENSTEAMRESQSPWLYTSVVSSDYDAIHDRVYSSGFDKKVKVWKVDQAGASMRCIGTWEHEGSVNFVQASLFNRPDVGLVATAADVPTDAVRVYYVSKDDEHIAQSQFVPFSCSRIMNLDGTPMVIDKWTYFPSTMRWGVEQSVKHLLLVGYSPRSLTGDDNDIPPDRYNTGELCLWDAITGDRVTITSARTQNVFEVLWHPTQPVFIAATSPAGYALNFDRVKTQVRIFKRVVDNGYSASLAFSEVKALDCYAVDINELTIMPNSAQFCYVTAGCTDGKTYVWDTALGDKPVQVLDHGQPVAGVAAGDDTDDTGVKFTAWGTSMDRFYTGSSDGIVKVWNVRCSGKKAQGRVLLEAPAQISFGAFSPDKSKLVIGDASGRIFVLSTDYDDGSPPSFVSLPGGIQKRVPTTITPHVDPLPPPGIAPTDGRTLGHAYIVRRQLRYSGDPTIGMVKDTNYAETGLYCREAYLNSDTSMPVHAYFEAYLQTNAKMYSNLPSRTKALRRVAYAQDEMSDTQDAKKALLKKHETNCGLDLDYKNLGSEIRDVLASQDIGERELYEGPEYPDLAEDEEADLRRATAEVVEWDPTTADWGEKTGTWV